MTAATKVRAIAADVRTAGALGAAVIILHSWWFARSEHKADVISGFGVAMAVLGILVAAQPLMQVGIETAARRQVGLVSDERRRAIEQDEHAVAAKAAKRIFHEQVVGGSLIAIGTLFNGYAMALARLFSLPV